MWNRPGGLLFSATDLTNFLGGQHSSALDLRHLLDPIGNFAIDPMAEMPARKGLEHEHTRERRTYLETLRREGRTITELDQNAPLEVNPAGRRDDILVVSPAGQSPQIGAAFRRARRHRRQVPRSGGAGRADLDGDLLGRRRPPQPRISVQPESSQRRDFPRAKASL